MTFILLATEWLESRRAGKRPLRKSSLINYGAAIGSLQKFLTKLEYAELDICGYTESMIQEIYDRLITVYALETVINFSKVLVQPLTYAVKKGYITTNPCQFAVITPKDTDIYKEVQIFYDEEIQKLMELSCKQYKKDMILLAYRTGMRIGEIIALKWEDVSFEEEYIFVQRTLSYYRNKNDYKIEKPKTRNSLRKIAVDRKTIQMLKERRKYAEHEWVFCNDNGEIYSRQAMNIGALCRQAKIPERPFHALRHTNATNLLLGGVEREIVQRRLGHASITTTEKTYCHVPLPMQNKAVSIIDKW